jgi:hypothetical protein
MTDLTKNAVRYAALLLLENNPTTSTLEVKELCRHVGLTANQQDVSDFMADLAVELPLHVDLDRSTMRVFKVYSLPTPAAVLDPFSSSTGNNQTVVVPSGSALDNLPKPRSQLGAMLSQAVISPKQAAKNTSMASKLPSNVTLDKASAHLDAVDTAVVDLSALYLQTFHVLSNTEQVLYWAYKNIVGFRFPLIKLSNLDLITTGSWAVTAANSTLPATYFPGTYTRDQVRQAYSKRYSIPFSAVRSSRV